MVGEKSPLHSSVSARPIEDPHDDKNKPNGDKHLANPKPTPIPGSSVVIVHGKHQNHCNKG
jgi:hypothetical protein